MRHPVPSAAHRLLRGIIVEGTDGSGKTSLVGQLKAALSGSGWDVVQMGHREGDQFDRYLDAYLKADRLLFDRSHVSEVVYGDLLREGRHFTSWQRRILDTIAQREFLTVLCTAPVDLLRVRHLYRDFATASVAFEDTLRRHIDDRALAEAHRHFARTMVDPTLVCESISDAALTDVAGELLARLRAAEEDGRIHGAKSPSVGATPGLIVIDGPSRRSRARVAELLSDHLEGWHVAAGDLTGQPFDTVMAAYVAADQTLVVGGHVLAEADASEARYTARESRHLNEYLASRGAVVLCRGGLANASGTDRRFGRATRDDLIARGDRLCRDWDIACHVLDLDDPQDLPPDGINRLVSSLLGRTLGQVAI